MPRSLTTLTILAMCAAPVLGGTHTPSAPSAVTACAPTDDPHWSNLRGYLRNLYDNRDSVVIRGRIRARLPDATSADLHPVTSDSLCALAGRMINRGLRLPDSIERKVFLVAIRDVYWAEDPTTRVAEVYVGYVFDSTLTTVLSRTGR